LESGASDEASASLQEDANLPSDKLLSRNRIWLTIFLSTNKYNPRHRKVVKKSLKKYAKGSWKTVGNVLEL